jgi:hypothetical protein
MMIILLLLSGRSSAKGNTPDAFGMDGMQRTDEWTLLR